MRRSRLYSTNLKVLLGSECCKTKVSVLRSMIQEARAENGVFPSRNSENENLVLSCYWLLAYADLGREVRSGKQYGEGCMEATLKTYWKRVVEMEGSLSDGRCQEDFVWTVLAPFYVTRYIRDPRYLAGGKEGTAGVEIESRKPNLQLRASKTVSTLEFTKHEILCVAALRNFKDGEELFVSYGKKVMF